ncbi:MAG: nucleotidyl transferase AbiEii/AbiGii toxin family protein [Rhodospirillaceae bacterium]
MFSPSSFKPHLAILPAAQRALWPELRSTPEAFTLYGGTAIALHLGHRESVDFDFFSAVPFDPQHLLSSIEYLHDAEVYQIQPGSLGCRLIRKEAPVQLSFFAPNDFSRLDPPHIASDTGLQIASLRDLAVSKLTVIQQRAERKDYLDLHALIYQAKISLSDMLVDAHLAYGHRFAPLASMQALSFFDEGDVAALSEGQKGDLTRAVNGVNLDAVEARIDALTDRRDQDL